jgi:deoxycytidine triphosphate deaminase
MDYEILIITGTRGVGKSTVGRKLCEKHADFQLVEAITTRPRREDDVAGEYQYVSAEEFSRLKTNSELFIESEYDGSRYGITHQAINRIKASSRIPLLIITPESAAQLETDGGSDGDKTHKYFSVFLDANDDVLDRRLSSRGKQSTQVTFAQRESDRSLAEACLYTVQNRDLAKTLQLLWSLWEYRLAGGVLSKRLIMLMIECGMLLNNANLSNVTGAAYDLSIGDEYYYGGRIKTLSNNEPFILVEPYDYAIVTSNELTNLPKDVVARFDLSVSLFCQGMILSNGPQVDAGFRGRLFCLLFNTSNAPVFLKRGQHYATIEFHKMIEPTTSYTGQYQGKESIVNYLPSNTMRGAINELKKELEQVRVESRNLQGVFLGVISLILAVIAILLAIR